MTLLWFLHSEQTPNSSMPTAEKLRGGPEGVSGVLCANNVTNALAAAAISDYM